MFGLLDPARPSRCFVGYYRTFDVIFLNKIAGKHPIKLLNEFNEFVIVYGLNHYGLLLDVSRPTFLGHGNNLQAYLRPWQTCKMKLAKIGNGF